MFYTLKGLVVKNMDKESFAALLEDTKSNPWKEYKFKNGISIIYSRGNWDVITKELVFSFNYYRMNSKYIEMYLTLTYLGLIDCGKMERVD